MIVSVVIPCYNCEVYIEETLMSVINQELKEVQIICVDNLSTDSTADLLKEYSIKYKNIEVYLETRRGANYARNLGIKKAKGKYIQFLDADDIISKDKLLKQSKYLESNGLDIVISDRKVFNSDMSRELESFSFEDVKINPLFTAVSKIIITGNPLYRAEYVKKIGGFLEGLQAAQDWEFHIRFFLSNPQVGYLKGCFLFSRQLNDSLSSNHLKVSNNACQVILDNKTALINKDIFSSEKALRKIFLIYQESYIHSHKELKESYLNELLFWYYKSNTKNFFQGITQLLVAVFGIKFVVKLKRFLN